MSLKKNFQDVVRAVVPIVLLVLVASLVLVQISFHYIRDFVIGALFILGGLSIFLTGISLGVERIGRMLGERVKDLSSGTWIFFFGFLLGCAITVAEPDLMILAKSIEESTAIHAYLIIGTVSLGVGFMVGWGFLRILSEVSIKVFFLFFYVLIFVLFFTQNDSFRGFSFDASGATTGAMTTPFLLSLTMGISKLKGSDKGEKDAFGMVGIASIGPILAVLLLGIFKQTTAIPMDTSPEGLTFVRLLWNAMVESFLAIFPITILYLYYKKKMELSREEQRRIHMGLVYSYVGLVLFMTGVTMGFTEMAYFLGKELFAKSPSLFLLFGFAVGLMVVLAEPAVYALTDQIEDVTSGSVDKRLLRAALSLGVGMAILLSGLRITYAGFKLWMYVIPGFTLALLFMRKTDPIFVGIAFDAGGVASGPMTATFVLSLMQGAAIVSKAADPVVDGFGVIASVAMAPVLSLMILGRLYSGKR